MGIPLRGCGRWIACQIRMPLGSNPSRATKERNPSLLSPARRSAGADSRRVSRIDLNFGSGSRAACRVLPWQVRSASRNARRYGRVHAMNVGYRWLRAPATKVISRTERPLSCSGLSPFVASESMPASAPRSSMLSICVPSSSFGVSSIRSIRPRMISAASVRSCSSFSASTSRATCCR